MKKAVTVITLMIFLSLALTASSLFIGAGGGATYNRIIAGENYLDYKYLSGFAYKAYIPVTVECTKYFGFETGVSMSEKAYHIEREAGGTKTVDMDERNVFLTVPVALRISLPLVDNISLFVSLGGYAGWYMGGKRSGKVLGSEPVSVSVEDTVDMNYRSRYAYGVHASLGYAVDISSLRFSTLLGYSLDLSDIHREETYGSYPLHNSTFDISLSLQWRAR